MFDPASSSAEFRTKRTFIPGTLRPNPGHTCVIATQTPLRRRRTYETSFDAPFARGRPGLGARKRRAARQRWRFALGPGRLSRTLNWTRCGSSGCAGESSATAAATTRCPPNDPAAGLELAAARLFAVEGARVVVTDRRKAELDRAVGHGVTRCAGGRRRHGRARQALGRGGTAQCGNGRVVR
jgi:hypothetical protein